MADIFLSYSRKDSKLMQRLLGDLEEAGFTVWIDKEDLKPGTAIWQNAVEEAINQAKCMVVILSPDAKQSKWVVIEASTAEDKGLGIFPVLARGTKQDAVLFMLRMAQFVDIRNDYEPVRTELIPAIKEYLLGKVTPPPIVRKSLLKNLFEQGGLFRRWEVLVPALLMILFIGWAISNNLPGLRGGSVTPTPPQIAVITETASLTQEATDTPTPDLTGTEQAKKTAQARIDLTRTALAPTLSPTPTDTSTPPPPTPTTIPTATPTPLPTNTPTLQSGATRTNPKDGAVYVWIPPGKFSMGSSDEDKLARPDEKPQHTVEVDGFWIMQNEVAIAQYKRCVAAGGCTGPIDPSTGKPPIHWADDTNRDHPVVFVDRNQAQTYAEWAGGRLPTEAEWEKACRGTDGRIYPWGNQSHSADRLNFAGSDNFGTVPVGSYPPGVNGLYDMVGNVWEWTADRYNSNYYANSTLLSNPKGPEDGQHYTLRGGSFGNHVVDYVRCAARFWNGGNEGSNDIGFRVMSPGF